MKYAVIYYSRSGVTKRIAEMIERKFDADMYFVEPEKSYGGYLSAVARAGAEKLSKKPVEVKTKLADFSQYDVVFIGFPVWYGTVPGFLAQYLKKCDLKGKRIIPFATAGANGKESSLKTVKELFPYSNVTDYFYTSMSDKHNPKEWLDSLSLD